MERIVYVCHVCLRVSPEADECHGQPMHGVDCGPPGSELCRPIMGEHGRPKAHAPRWWVEHVLTEARRE